MNICELTEKNVYDAVKLFRYCTSGYSAMFLADASDDAIAKKMLLRENDGDFSYLSYDRGTLLAMVTINKAEAQMDNLFINFSVVDNAYANKFLEFVIKQFSAISRVFVWAISADFAMTELLEEYGFEYTGEQQYLSKDKTLSRFRYVYKRKK